MGSYAKHNETNCFPLVPMQNIVVRIGFMKTQFGVPTRCHLLLVMVIIVMVVVVIHNYL